MFGATRLTVRPPGADTKHVVVNDHGFGTGPATRGFPSLLLPKILIVYCVHCASAGLGVSVRTVSPAVHADEKVAPGEGTHETVAVSIPRLNVTTMDALGFTPVVPLAGTVEETCGGGQNVRNDQGFGTGPGPRFTPVESCPRTWTW